MIFIRLGVFLFVGAQTNVPTVLQALLPPMLVAAWKIVYFLPPEPDSDFLVALIAYYLG
jgi:hypothetical protein